MSWVGPAPTSQGFCLPLNPKKRTLAKKSLGNHIGFAIWNGLQMVSNFCNMLKYTLCRSPRRKSWSHTIRSSKGFGQTIR